MMGSDVGDQGREHWVSLSPFYIQEHPVTNAEYQRFRPEHQFPKGKEDHPVVNVSWAEAMAHAQWLGGSLPTEAQWEFAARGTEGRHYPWGESEPTSERANYLATGKEGTTPVKSFPKGATPEGIHDLAGNVCEWCRDWYGPYEGEEERDPVGPQGGSFRVLRGGGFSSIPETLRAACRGRYHPVGRFDIGFRVAWSAAGGQN